MKKILFFAGLLCLAGTGLRSQTMVQNWLTQSNNAAITNSDDKPYYTHVDANGMVGIVGVSNNKVILAAYDANGNDLWTNKLGSYSSDQPLGLEKGPNGNFYVGYYWSGNLRKVGLNGGNSWTTASSSYHGADFVVDANGDAYMVGTDYSRSTIYIDKILANGTKTWTKTYSGPMGYGGQPVHVKQDHAGNLLIAIDANNSVGDRYLSVAKFDTAASATSPTWDTVYTTTKGNVYDLIVDKTTNACYVTGSVEVGSFNQRDMIAFRVNVLGGITWTDVYNNANSDDIGHSLEQDAAGNIYVLMDSHNPMTKYTIRKYASNGTFITSNGVTYLANGYYMLKPHIMIHPTTNQIYFSGTRTSMNNDNELVMYKADPALTTITQIYTYDHDVTDGDFSTAINYDPTTQDIILTGNIFKTVTGNDYYYAKTDTLGNYIYSNIFNGVINGRDYVSSVVTDASNNPAVAGGTESTLTDLDAFMVKYDASGNEQWQAVIPGVGGFKDYFETVDINTSGHYYAGGWSESSTGNPDMWIVKIDGNGSKLWDIKLTGTQTGNDAVSDIFTDNFNNGYAVGYQTNAGTGQDAAIIKFNSSGSVLWSKKYTGSGNQKDAYRDIGSRNAGVYAVGYTTKPNGESDMLIAKYDANGNLQWSRTYNSPQSGNDTAISVNVDNNQNIAVVGSSDSAKVITLRYDANGNLLWAVANEKNISVVGPDVVAMNNGMAFITCRWDSLPATPITKVICYDKTGSKKWEKNYYPYGPMKMSKTSRYTVLVALDYNGDIGAIEIDTLGNEKNNVQTNISNPYSDPFYGGTRCITLDGNGDVYVAGYQATETGSDAVVQKLCYTPAPATINGPVSVCAQSTGNIYSVTSNTTVTNYNWGATGGLNVAGSAANGASVNAGNSSGYVYVTQTNYCGTGQADTLHVVVTALPLVNAGADMMICPNNAVTLSGSGATSYTWSGGVVNGVPFTPATSAGYQLTGEDANGCINKDTVIVLLKNPPAVGLCVVTVDTFSTHNILTWEKTGLTNEIAYFNIYREDITNNYTLIGVVPFDSLSQYHDYDTTMADPNVTTKRYKIAAVDTCGNEGPRSFFHNTIFVGNNNGTFTWNTYVIQNSPNPVNNYALYRDDLSNGNWNQIGTTAGTQNVLSDPNYSTYQSTGSWRIETIWNISCTPTARQSNSGALTAIVKSKSNIVNNRAVGVRSFISNFAVYPNPTNGQLTIAFSNINSGKANIRITSLLGTEIYNENVSGEKHNIDMSRYDNGVYVVQVTTVQGTAIKQIVKN